MCCDGRRNTKANIRFLENYASKVNQTKDTVVSKCSEFIPTCLCHGCHGCFFSFLSLALSFSWHVCVSMLSVSTLVGTLEEWCSIYVAEITGWHTPAAHFPHHLLVFLKSSSSSPSLPDHIALLTVALFSSSSMFRTSWCLPFALLSSSPKSSVCHPVARGSFGNSLWLGETNWIVIQTGNTNLPAYSLTSCLASSCARKAE